MQRKCHFFPEHSSQILYGSLADELGFCLKIKASFSSHHRRERQVLFSDQLLILCHLLPMKRDCKESSGVALSASMVLGNPLLSKR